MLVMSRREGEVILIGDEVEILIAHIGRSRVKIGVRAPRSLLVQTRESRLVRDENLAAAAVKPSVEALTSLVNNWQPTASSSTKPAGESSVP